MSWIQWKGSLAQVGMRRLLEEVRTQLSLDNISQVKGGGCLAHEKQKQACLGCN